MRVATCDRFAAVGCSMTSVTDENETGNRTFSVWTALRHRSATLWNRSATSIQTLESRYTSVLLAAALIEILSSPLKMDLLSFEFIRCKAISLPENVNYAVKSSFPLYSLQRAFM